MFEVLAAVSIETTVFWMEILLASSYTRLLVNVVM
jgi:hypothetical protein